MMCFLVFIIACGNINDTEFFDSSLPKTGRYPKVLAITPLLADWVKQVGGEKIDLEILIPYSVDPHNYHPSPKDVTKINDADLIFLIGLNYESPALMKLFKNATLDDTNIINLGSQVNPIKFYSSSLSNNDQHEDQHEDENHHNYSYDPHFWFDPMRVALAIGEISTHLSLIDPDNKSRYLESAQSYVLDLKQIDLEIRKSFEIIPKNKRTIMTTHESLGYLRDVYGINVLPAMMPSLSTDRELSPKNLVKMLNMINKYNINIIFIESEVPSVAFEAIFKEEGVKLVKGIWSETLQNNETYADFILNNVSIIVSNLSEKK